jgi:L-threonylcarbamoyladenylate synthase
MKNFSDFSEDIKNACDVLRKGGTILYPTDTIWGLGCDATNKDAVSKIFELKKRPENMSMIVLVCNEVMIERYVREVPEIAWQLIEVADKPITIIYPGARNLAVNAIASDGTIGIRICKDDFCNQLISRFGKPIISTSANFSGEKSPSFFDEISEDLAKAVDYSVTYRQSDTQPTEPSSIIKIGLGGEIKIIRK